MSRLIDYSFKFSYKDGASCTLTLFCGIFKTLTQTVLFAYSIFIISPSFNCFEGFAGLLLTRTRPMSETSLATVLLFINRETFKYLSNRIFIPLLFTILSRKYFML